ncbi:MAG: hypothetical protein ABL883_11495 [Terricaulis sp.]
MLNDEVLGAYIDDELGPDQRGEVERLIGESPGAQMRLERMRVGDAALRRAFAAESVGAGSDNVAELVRRGWPSRPATRMFWAGSAIAAACLLGVIGGRLTQSPQLGPGMHLSPDMIAALEYAPSGESVAVSGGEMEVALSFSGESGEVCRQYRTTSSQQRVDAIACRDSGAWRIAVQAVAVESQAYRTAAASDPIAATVERMGGASVLDADEEQTLIANRWRAR